jgi:hypothetical protein
MRLIIPRGHWEAHIALMQARICGKFPGLVFNLDEVGACDQEDRKLRKAVAAMTISAGEVSRAVSCRYRYVTFLACVSAVGDALISVIISQAPVRDSLCSRGFRGEHGGMVRTEADIGVTHAIAVRHGLIRIRFAIGNALAS